MGDCLGEIGGAPLSPLTAVIGKNGTGKSTLFDAFGFLADCVTVGVEAACDRDHRGGFERLRSRGIKAPISFTVHYRESHDHSPIMYQLRSIGRNGAPDVASEALQSREPASGSHKEVRFYCLSPVARCSVRPGRGNVQSDRTTVTRVALTDMPPTRHRQLGTLRDHPRISRFRDFIKGWYLSYFTPDAARGLPIAGPQRHLNVHGDNMAMLFSSWSAKTRSASNRFCGASPSGYPGSKSIETKVTEDKRVLLRFNDKGFTDPFFAQQMSDGTLKLFAYMLLLEDPEPSPLICIEEPENGLYHKLLETSWRRNSAHMPPGATTRRRSFVTTHQPYFVDAPVARGGLDSGKRRRRILHHPSRLGYRTCQVTWSPRACRWAGFGTVTTFDSR